MVIKGVTPNGGVPLREPKTRPMETVTDLSLELLVSHESGATSVRERREN